MIFVIRKDYDPAELVNFLNRLNDNQHENFWEFFSAFRIFVKVDDEELVARKKATTIYHFALIEKKDGEWKGVSCSKDKTYLEKQVSKYPIHYSKVEHQILPTRVGLIVKQDYKSLLQVNLGV